MQFIDTHIHLQDDKSNNATEIINRAKEEGAVKLLCVAALEEDWGKIETLSKQFSEMIVPAFGLHPWYTVSVKKGWQNRLIEKMQKFPYALIGECGLDGFKPEIEKQKNLFAEQIKIAKRFKRPLIVHAVKAVPLMEDFWDDLPEKFVIHGFNDKTEFLKRIIQKGGYVGIGSGLLKTPKAKEILNLIPQDKLLFETDAPFQANYPWQIKEQARQIALLRQESAEELAQQVYQNSVEFIK